MNQNKVNNLEAMKLVGPCRPRDILKMEPENIEIAWVRDNRAQIIFKKSYFKCGSNHILVNENFDSIRDLNPITKAILPNSTVHIFIDDYHCDTMGLLAFCNTISQKECVNIVIHLSRNCRFRDYIEEYFPKLERIKFKLCNITTNKGVDFWCTEWYHWQRDRAMVIHDGNKTIPLYGKNPEQWVNGICVKLSPFHGLVRHKAFDVIGIQSNFMPDEYNRTERDFEFTC